MVSSKYSPHTMKTFHFMRDINEHRLRVKNEPTWVKVTTITMLSDMKCRLDPEVIRSYFSKYKHVRLTARGTRRFNRRKEGTFNAWRLSNTSFYNQVSICYQDSRSGHMRSVKIFPNGSIQVAGATDLIDCRDMIIQLCAILTGIFKKKFTVRDFRIAMINTNFSMNRSMNLKNVFRTFSDAGILTEFNPDRYSAVKVKIQPTDGSKRVTVSIFRTGKVIMTGAEKLSEISDTYGFVLNLLYGSSLKVFYSDASKDDDPLEYFRGYRIPDLLENLKKKGVLE